MRRLLLLRHAKSDWPEGLHDTDRPLAPRGRATAPAMGSYMAVEGLIADRVLVSPARRTRETWDLVAEKLSGTPEVIHDARIYEAPAARLLAVVREQPGDVHTLLMVGHNPGSENLAELLIGSGSLTSRTRMAEKFPTGALAVIDLPVDAWADVLPHTGRLDRFVTPRSLIGDA